MKSEIIKKINELLNDCNYITVLAFYRVVKRMKNGKGKIDNVDY